MCNSSQQGAWHKLARLAGDAGVDAVKDARHADEDCRPQRADVIHQRLRAALPVADAGADGEEEFFRDAAKDVCKRQIRQERVVCPATSM